MNLRSPLRAGGVALASLSLVVAGLGGGSAHADDNGDVAPVTADDTVHVVGGAEGKPVDVLANDSDADDPADLGICRVTVPQGVPLEAGVEHTQTGTDVRGDPVFRDVIDLQTTSSHAGTYRLTYYACDYQYLTPATLTVRVDRSYPVTLTRVKGHRGVFSFHNPGPWRFHVFYIASGPRSTLGRFVLAPHSSHRVRAGGAPIKWEATSRHASYGGVLEPPVHVSPPTSASRRAAPAAAVGPSTSPDRVRITQGQYAFVRVLGNDGNPPSAHVQVCRATVPANSRIQAEPLNGYGDFLIFSGPSDGSQAAPSMPVVPRLAAPPKSPLMVYVPSDTPVGTYRVTYYACDFSYLTPGTVTVTVIARRDVTAVALPHHPGVVRFHNPSGHVVQVEYLTAHEHRGHRVRVAAHASTLVRVPTRTLQWFAFSRSDGEVGSGVLRHIPQPTR